LENHLTFKKIKSKRTLTLVLVNCED